MTAPANTRQAARALILAAGLSTRMGGNPKALLPVGGASMLSLGVRSLREGGVGPVAVVTGHEHEAVAREAARSAADVVFNPDYRLGMESSLRAGLAALATAGGEQGALPCFILPVDACLVRPQSIRALLDALHALLPALRERALFIPTYHDTPGHPPLLGAWHIGEIMRQSELPGGLRGYIASCMKKADARAFLYGRAGHAGCGRAVPRAVPFAAVPVSAKNRSVQAFFLPLPDARLVDDIDEPHNLAAAAAREERTAFGKRPLLDEALDWLLHSGCEAWKLKHGIAVARGALRLCAALAGAGRVADPELAVCGGLLHDVARKQRRHAYTAMGWIARRGWAACSLVAGVHTRFPAAFCSALGFAGAGEEYIGEPPAVPEDEAVLHAAAAVYLADKYFYGDTHVPLAERFAGVKKHFAEHEEALRAIALREKTSERMEAWFAQLTGCAPAILVQEPCAHPLEDFLSDAHAAVAACTRRAADAAKNGRPAVRKVPKA